MISNHDAKAKVLFDAYKNRLGILGSSEMVFALVTIYKPHKTWVLQRHPS